MAAEVHRQPVDAGVATGSTHHQSRGLWLRAQGRLEEAVDAFRAALADEPDAVETLACLGNALKALGRFDEALTWHLRAVELSQHSEEHWSNLGLSFQASGSLDAALMCLERATRLGRSAESAHNLAAALLKADRNAEAEQAARLALARDEQHCGAAINLGVALRGLGRLDEALVVLRRAVALDPENPDAHFNMGLALLSLGQFTEGWAERQWRERIPEMRPPVHTGPEPPWDGSPLGDRTLLLRAEQGFGDSLQFVRYAQVIKQTCGGRILFQCQPPLRRLLQGVSGLEGIIPAGEPLPPFDVEALLLAVPALLPPAQPPVGAAYLAAEAPLIEAWRRRLDTDGPATLRIGLGYQGNPRYRADRRRSIPLNVLVPLLRRARELGARVYSLQKGAAREQIADLPSDLGLIDLGADLDEGTAAFVETAAVISNLDLVISSDTALPHLAGALAAPAWLLLCFSPDWRWGVTGDRTPWYPTMRLYRQAREGDWGSVVTAVCAALEGEIAKRTQP